jgi:hypothetical protein
MDTWFFLQGDRAVIIGDERQRIVS